MLGEGNGAILHNELAPRGSQCASTPRSVSATASGGGNSPWQLGEHRIEANAEGLELEQGA